MRISIKTLLIATSFILTCHNTHPVPPTVASSVIPADYPRARENASTLKIKLDAIQQALLELMQRPGKPTENTPLTRLQSNLNRLNREGDELKSEQETLLHALDKSANDPTTIEQQQELQQKIWGWSAKCDGQMSYYRSLQSDSTPPQTDPPKRKRRGSLARILRRQSTH